MMFAPRSIAFIGASESSGFFLNLYDHIGDTGRRCYFVNPNREEVLGQECHSSVTDVEERIDLALILVPSVAVVDVFRECCEADVDSAVVVSDIVEDDGGIEAELSRLSAEHGLPFCGPNTYGLLSEHDDFHGMIGTIPTTVRPGGFSIVSQSGSMLSSIYRIGIERGFGISGAVDSGNQYDLSISDYVRYFLSDDHTEYVVGVIEEIKKPELFLEVAEQATEANVPIVAMKIGRSEKGNRATQSHTGSMTTSYDTLSAVLESVGVIEVPSVEVLAETMELVEKVSPSIGRNVAVFDYSGGMGAHVSDLISETSLRQPDLSAESKETIRSSLPPFGSAGNPTDTAVPYTADGFDDILSALLEGFAADDDVDVVIARVPIMTDEEMGIVVPDDHLRKMSEFNEEVDGTEFMAMTRPSFNSSADLRQLREEVSIPVLRGMSTGIAALELVTEHFGRTDPGPAEPEITRTYPLESTDGIVDEFRAKRILAEHGLRTAREEVATSAAEAIAHAESVGAPYCMKIVSPDIPHKTEIGGVETDIEDVEAAGDRYEELLARAEAARPDARIEGVLVQEMVPEGTEIFVGGERTRFGPTIVVGTGGEFAEIAEDSAMTLAPIGPEVAKELLGELRVHEVLEGYRGKAPRDVDELAATIADLSQFLAAYDTIEEIDVNPVIATPEEAIIVDAVFYT